MEGKFPVRVLHSRIVVGADSDFERLKEQGSGQPAPEAVVRLYHEAFRKYGVRALWSRRAGGQPTIAQALVISDALRREGDLGARALAVRIEEACRAAL